MDAVGHPVPAGGIRINRNHVGGGREQADDLLVVRDVMHENVVSSTVSSSLDDIEAALAAADALREELAATPAFRRAQWLRDTAAALETRAEDAAALLVSESGKPLRIARDEVVRAAETLRFSADAALGFSGGAVPMDASIRGTGRLGIYLRVPVGIVAGITPFNAPLNLLCHKVGPALAAGNAIVAKPDPRTPSTADLLFGLLHEAGVPRGAAALLQGGAAVGASLVSDNRVDLISFTGGHAAAQAVRRLSGLKKAVFELGGNAANIVCADADLDEAARQLASNGFSHAGQSCIGVQRIYIERAVASRFRELFLSYASALRVGDPHAEETDVGPMIDAASVARLLDWIAEARRGGADILLGGMATGRILSPTVLDRTRPDMRVVCEEVFGPIVILQEVESVDQAIACANESRYGMQAGIFTRSLDTAMQAMRRLRVGGVIVNGTSNYRVDHQPYGGIKASGVGREGPLFAIEEMSDIRMVVLQ